MVIGLLIVGAIPTTIGTCEAVSTEKKQRLEAKRAAKFHITTICDPSAKRRRKKQVDGKVVVLRDGRLFLDNAPEGSGKLSGYPFTGYYFQYPSEEKLEGLVSTISNDPPMLNWIYVDTETLEVRYGNRTATQGHIIGPWGWTDDEKLLNLEERTAFVAVQEEDDSWGLYYDLFGDWGGLPEDGKILDVSLERRLMA